MRMINSPTEKNSIKVKFNELLIIERFKTCHSGDRWKPRK